MTNTQHEQSNRAMGFKETADFNAAYTLKDPDHDEIRDGYQLRWVGKNYARLQEGLRPETVIVPDSEHNAKPGNRESSNLFLTGDNLEVLKHLEHAYSGKVDLIYIDPPYNTGSDGFVYDDSFGFTDQQLIDTLGLTVLEVQRIRNLFGRASHSAWLTFMYPRLRIARRLLKDFGALVVSIDDNEQANLKLLLDEVFGEQRFVATVPWRKRTAKSDVPYAVSQDFEYLLVYAASTDFLAGAPIERRYFETPDFPGDRWRLADLRKQTTAAERPNSAFDMVNPKNGEVFPFSPNRTWAITADTFSEHYQNGKIVFPGDYDFLKISIPASRVFESEDKAKALRKYGSDSARKAVSTLLPKEVGLSEDGNNDIVQLFGEKVFAFPKPVSLLSYILSRFTHNEALVLDFFAGSGTTAQAVMKLNKEDGGSRRYILCNISEPVKEGTSAFAAGYRTIDAIARERVSLAAQVLTDGAGYRHFRFVEPNENNITSLTEFQAAQMSLIPEDMVAPFSEHQLTGHGSDDGVPTILTTWLLGDGYDFDMHPQPLDLAGYAAHYAPEIARLYLIDNTGWTSSSCETLLNLLGRNEIAVNTVVIYPYSFQFTELTEIKNNLRAALDTPPQILERY